MLEQNQNQEQGDNPTPMSRTLPAILALLGADDYIFHVIRKIPFDSIQCERDTLLQLEIYHSNLEDKNKIRQRHIEIDLMKLKHNLFMSATE